MATSVSLLEEVVGYGFHPTNEQLVGHYLRRKRLDPDYSHPKITETNINDHEPSELLGESDASERYLFVAPRYTNTKRKLVKRRTRGGTWKATGKTPDVKEKRSKKVIGSKRKLVFYEGPSTRNKNARTNYVMDELHCNPDPLFKADFVVVRIKIKPDDSCDSSTTSESLRSHQLTSDSRDLFAEVSQVESQQLPNNDMSRNSEDYCGDIMFFKDSHPLQNHDISPNRISQTQSNHDISPNIISQPLAHHHISLNRVPDLLPNQDISFNRGNQPQPDNHTPFNTEVQPLSTNNFSLILPHPNTSFNTDVQPLANYNLPSILPRHEIPFNREFQPVPHDISSNGESHVVPNYNLSSILPDQDISSNRVSQPQINHGLYATHLQQQVCDSLIEYNEPNQNSFSAQQTSSRSCDFSSDSNVLNTPLGSEWESYWSNSQWDFQYEFSEKESGHSHTPDFQSTKPATGAAYVYSSSDESALLNGDSSGSNSPLGSKQETNWSNSKWGVLDEFYGKEAVPFPPGFNLSMPVTEAHAYGGSDKTIDEMLMDAMSSDDALLYGFSPTT